MAPAKTLACVIAGATFLSIHVGIFRGEHSLGHYFRLTESSDILAKRVETLEKECESLSREIVRIKGSSKYARTILKDRYHVVEKDEDIIFFADP